MDKGYYLLRALGYDTMAQQARSTKDEATSTSCLTYILNNFPAGTPERTAEQIIIQEVLESMGRDEWRANDWG